MLAAILELPNFAADQEGFGSLSAALAIAWHGTGDSVLVKYLLGRAAAPAPAGESPCWLLGGVFRISLTAPLYYQTIVAFLCGDFEQFANNRSNVRPAHRPTAYSTKQKQPHLVMRLLLLM